MSKCRLTEFGVEIKKRLVEIGMTQKQLAEKIGSSEVYLNMILYGKRSGAKYIDKIIREVGLDRCKSK